MATAARRFVKNESSEVEQRMATDVKALASSNASDRLSRKDLAHLFYESSGKDAPSALLDFFAEPLKHLESPEGYEKVRNGYKTLGLEDLFLLPIWDSDIGGDGSLEYESRKGSRWDANRLGSLQDDVERMLSEFGHERTGDEQKTITQRHPQGTRFQGSPTSLKEVIDEVLDRTVAGVGGYTSRHVRAELYRALLLFGNYNRTFSVVSARERPGGSSKGGRALRVEDKTWRDLALRIVSLLLHVVDDPENALKAVLTDFDLALKMAEQDFRPSQYDANRAMSRMNCLLGCLVEPLGHGRKKAGPIRDKTLSTADEQGWASERPSGSAEEQGQAAESIPIAPALKVYYRNLLFNTNEGYLSLLDADPGFFGLDGKVLEDYHTRSLLNPSTSGKNFITTKYLAYAPIANWVGFVRGELVSSIRERRFRFEIYRQLEPGAGTGDCDMRGIEKELERSRRRSGELYALQAEMIEEFQSDYDDPSHRAVDKLEFMLDQRLASQLGHFPHKGVERKRFWESKRLEPSLEGIRGGTGEGFFEKGPNHVSVTASAYVRGFNKAVFGDMETTRPLKRAEAAIKYAFICAIGTDEEFNRRADVQLGAYATTGPGREGFGEKEVSEGGITLAGREGLLRVSSSQKATGPMSVASSANTGFQVLMRLGANRSSGNKERRQDAVEALKCLGSAWGRNVSGEELDTCKFVALDDFGKRVSTFQCAIVRYDEDYWLVDLGSRFGTVVARPRMASFEVILRGGAGKSISAKSTAVAGPEFVSSNDSGAWVLLKGRSSRKVNGADSEALKASVQDFKKAFEKRRSLSSIAGRYRSKRIVACKLQEGDELYFVSADTRHCLTVSIKGAGSLVEEGVDEPRFVVTPGTTPPLLMPAPITSMEGTVVIRGTYRSDALGNVPAILKVFQGSYEVGAEDRCRRERLALLVASGRGVGPRFFEEFHVRLPALSSRGEERRVFRANHIDTSGFTAEELGLHDVVHALCIEDVGVSLQEVISARASGRELGIPRFDGEEAPGLEISQMDGAAWFEFKAKVIFDLAAQLNLLLNDENGALCHRDIKLANVCVAQYGPKPRDIRATLIDFESLGGSSGTVGDTYTQKVREVLIGCEDDPIAYDLGAFSIVCYQLLHDEPEIQPEKLTPETFNELPTGQLFHLIRIKGNIRDEPGEYVPRGDVQERDHIYVSCYYVTGLWRLMLFFAYVAKLLLVNDLRESWSIDVDANALIKGNWWFDAKDVRDAHRARDVLVEQTTFGLGMVHSKYFQVPHDLYESKVDFERSISRQRQRRRELMESFSSMSAIWGLKQLSHKLVDIEQQIIGAWRNDASVVSLLSLLNDDIIDDVAPLFGEVLQIGSVAFSFNGAVLQSMVDDSVRETVKDVFHTLVRVTKNIFSAFIDLDEALADWSRIHDDPSSILTISDEDLKTLRRSNINRIYLMYIYARNAAEAYSVFFKVIGRIDESIVYLEEAIALSSIAISDERAGVYPKRVEELLYEASNRNLNLQREITGLFRKLISG